MPRSVVRERALAGAARACDAEHGSRLRFQFARECAELDGRDDLRERARVSWLERFRCVLHEVEIATRQHVVDHALQPHALAVFGRVDARDAVALELLDLGRHDDAAAAAEYLDVRAAALFQQLDHVLEVLEVAALVGRDGDALHILLQRRVDDLADRAVVAEVDHLGARALQDATHDVDRRVVAVEQARRGDETDLVLGLVDELGGVGQVRHALSLVDVYVNVNLDKRGRAHR